MADVEAVPGRLRAEVQRGGQLVDRLEATVVDTEKAIEAYESDRQHLETDSARLLRHFRGENERVRSTRPPGYFATLPQFPSQIDAGPVGLLNDRLTAVHQRFDALKDKAHRLEASQPERVQAATSRFEAFYNGQLRRADAGRGDSGDGADTLEGGQWS